MVWTGTYDVSPADGSTQDHDSQPFFVLLNSSAARDETGQAGGRLSPALPSACGRVLTTNSLAASGVA